ncbi:hypothetical protein OQA88_7043 [Cercophora sp. LCS_1]
MPPPEWTNIQPALLDSVVVSEYGGRYSAPDPEPHKGSSNLTFQFRVPLIYDHTKTAPSTLTINATLIHNPPDTSHTTISISHISYWKTLIRRPLLYLCGGPGDGNNPVRIPDLNRLALAQGYQILYVDYRGTGGSRPLLSGSHLATFTSASERANYIAQFRQDNIARDLEAIRLCLAKHTSKTTLRFTLLGQSFGGWIALTYLSFLPSSLEGVYLTAGLAPVGRTPTEVYNRLYQRVIERNEMYYRLYPGDAEHLRQVVKHLRGNEYEFRVDGSKGRHRLTAQTLMTLGRCFGGNGAKGMERVHALVEMMVRDVIGGGALTEETVAEYAALQMGGKKGVGFRLHERPLYGVLHEGIYCCEPGVVSGWAAERVGKVMGDEFGWLRDGWESRRGRLFFSGEMVFPFMLEAAGSELSAFREAAELLARKDDWPALYDEGQLARNKVPVRAVAYRDDMYVDFDLSVETGRKMKNCVVLEGKKHWGHGAVKAAETATEVLETLFGIRRL